MVVEILIISIAFVIFNLIWAILFVIFLSMSSNKPISRAFVPKKETEEPENEYDEATNEQLQHHFDKVNEDLAKSKEIEDEETKEVE